MKQKMCTSSFVRCERIRSIVNPVSSISIRFPSASQQAQDPDKINSNIRNIIIIERNAMTRYN